MKPEMELRKSRERFLRLTRSNEFITTSEVARRLRDGNWWTTEEEDTAVESWQEHDARHLIKQYGRNPETGEQEIINVKIADEEGNQVQGYMQVPLCEKPELQYAINYYKERALYYQSEAWRLNRMLKKRFGTQVKLPFDDPQLD
jgi:hypothetical protein